MKLIFSKPYYWTKELFSKKRRIYFSDLESIAGIEHLSISKIDCNKDRIIRMSMFNKLKISLL